MVQGNRLAWFGLILIVLLPLIGFIGSMLFPVFIKNTIRQRLPNPPMGRLYQLYFVQAFIVGLVLFALGFCLWLVQFWVTYLGSVTNPQIALQEQAIRYVVENRVELVDSYSEVFVGVAQDLGEDPDLALLSVIINNTRQLRDDPLLNFSASLVNIAWPLMSNLFVIAFALVLLFFLRRIWPELKQMLRYPVEVVIAEREGRPAPVFNQANPASAVAKVTPPQTYNVPPSGYPRQPQNYNMPQGGYLQNQTPQGYPPNYNMPPQAYPPQPQNYNTPTGYNQVPPNYSMPPQGYGYPPGPGPAKQPGSAVGVMWATGGRMIWNEFRSIFVFAILTFVLAIIMGIFLSLFFGPVVRLMVEVTSVGMIYFLRLDGASSIIVITTFLILLFLTECVVLFLLAFIFLLGKVLDGLRQHFMGNFTWKQTARFIWRNFLRFGWVCILALVLAIGFSIAAEKVVEAFLSSSDPNWFLSLVSAPIVLLTGLNLGFWLFRGFKTLRKMIRNTDALDIIVAAGSVVGGSR